MVGMPLRPNKVTFAPLAQHGRPCFRTFEHPPFRNVLGPTTGATNCPMHITRIPLIGAIYTNGDPCVLVGPELEHMRGAGQPVHHTIGSSVSLGWTCHGVWWLSDLSPEHPILPWHNIGP